jgi:L-aminoadipate-semialdehyde dehydrogenase
MAMAMSRLRSIGLQYQIWNDSWVSSKRIIIVLGDLAKPNFDIDNTIYESLLDTIDVVIHNGALV